MATRKGSPNKTSAAAKEGTIHAFEQLGGVPALVAWARENPTQFYTSIWGKLIPRESAVDVTSGGEPMIGGAEREARVIALLEAASKR